MSDTSKIQVPEELIAWEELTKKCTVKAQEFYKKEREKLDNEKPKLAEAIADIQCNITSVTNELCNSGFHFTETIRIIPPVGYRKAALKILFTGDDYIELECCIFCKKILSAKKIKLCYDDEDGYITLDGAVKFNFSELAKHEQPEPSEYTVPEPNIHRLLSTAKCYMNPNEKGKFKLPPQHTKLQKITQSFFNEGAIFDLYHVKAYSRANLQNLIKYLSRLIKLQEEFDKLARDEFYKHKELCYLFGHDISGTLVPGNYYKCACCHTKILTNSFLSAWEKAPYRDLVFPRPNISEPRVPLSDQEYQARKKLFEDG